MNLLSRFIKEEEGIGTIELVLIAVVLIGLVLLFKGQIMAFIDKIMQKITTDTDSILQ